MFLESTDRLNGGGRVTEQSDEEQLELCAQLTEELNNWRGKVQELDRVTNELLDTHPLDNGHNLSHLSSKLNAQWTKFNDQLRIRREVLEAAQNFHKTLNPFQQWLKDISAEMQKLERETNNAERVKDTGRRREWLAQEKKVRVEIDAHRETMESVKRMGRELLEEQRQAEEFSSSAVESPSPSTRTGDQLKQRMEAVDDEWQALVELSRIVHERLESAQECEQLMQSLADFLYWTDQQLKTIADSELYGDLVSVQQQSEIVHTIKRMMEARERQVEECIQLANTYMPPPLFAVSLLADPSSDLLPSPETESEREERRVGLQILADSGRLGSQWTLLKEQLGLWTTQLSKAGEMQELDRAIAKALLAIGTVEEEMSRLRPVEESKPEELKNARAECNEFQRWVRESGTSVDDVNAWAKKLQAAGIQLSEQLDSQVQAVNARYERLKRDIGCRGAALEEAAKAVLFLRGIPYDVSAPDVERFFAPHRCVDIRVGTLPGGRDSGDSFVQFPSSGVASEAMKKTGQNIRIRYIELFPAISAQTKPGARYHSIGGRGRAVASETDEVVQLVVKKASEEQQHSSKKVKKQVSLKDISMPKLIDRLKELGELETEFITYLHNSTDEVKQLKDENKKLTEQLQQANSKLAQAEQFVQKANVMQSELTKVRIELREERGMSKKYALSKEAETAQLKLDAEEALRSARSNFEDRLQATHAELNKEREQRVEMNKERQMAKQMMDKLGADMANSENRAREAAVSKTAYENKIQALQNELKREKDHHMQVTQNAQAQISELTSELDKAMMAYSNMVQQQSSESAKFGEMNLRNKQLEEEINRLKAQVQSAAKADEVQATVVDLTKRLDDQKVRNEDLREANYKLMDSIKHLQSTQHSLTSGGTNNDNSSKDISAELARLELLVVDNRNFKMALDSVNSQFEKVSRIAEEME